MAIIYILESKINKKCYVGQTTRTVKERVASHKSREYAIGNAINKYGIEKFNKFIFIVPEFLLDYFERKLIEKLNTLSPNGYNLESGGNKNKHHHQKTKNHLSETLKGRILTKEWRENISKSKKGKLIGPIHSIRWKKLLSIRMSGENHPLYGKKHTTETKLKMSKSHKGKHSGKKNGMYGIDPIDHPSSRKVICIDTGEIFTSIKEAGLKYNINSYSHISSCCNCKRKTVGRYRWRYYNGK